VERVVYGDRRLNGVVYLAVGTGSAVAAGCATRRLLGGPLATLAATAVCVAGRMLDEEAAGVGALVERDELGSARQAVRALVGRTPDELGAAELSRAAVESVAENSVDAVTASLFWASVGGAPAVLAHRAVNTLDAMVGHRDPRYQRFGWASARLDDVANWVPARLTAAAVALVRRGRAGDVLRTIRRDARRHPSPNGGVIEAAFAAGLGVQLGGVNRYGAVIEDRGTLGDGRPPTPGDVREAVRLRRHATAAVAVTLVVVQVLVRRRRR
jgi:adenosylcobinamide-phosphate synthase